MIKTYLHKLRAFIASRSFFYAIVALFLFSSSWIALSGRYPMAFDENYHYGIIKAYANQISPFFSHPPANSEVFGDITRYPSYLFHFLMSFPYRLISLFTGSDQVKIIILRLINIALLCSSLFIFKKIFEKLQVGKVVSNLALLFFVLTPVVPFLAAQINYDNAIIPLTALCVLLLIMIIERLKAGTFDIRLTLYLLIVCLLSSVVKFTFLPVFAPLGLAGLYVVFRESKQQNLHIWNQTKNGLSQITTASKFVIIGMFMLSLGLFVERYGLNIVKFKTPVPDCQQVLSEQLCLSYGPWARDHYLTKAKTGPPSWNATRYTGHWSAQNMHELFFAIDQNYYEQAPLPVPYYAAWVFGIGGVLLGVLNWRRMRRLAHVHLIGFIVVTYVTILWADNYQRFLSVNWPVAIHGRYLLPLLPLVYVLLAYAYKISFPRFKYANYLKAALATIAVLSMLQGGLVTYVVRSSDNWYWQNSTVIQINSGARRVLNSVLIH